MLHVTSWDIAEFRIDVRCFIKVCVLIKKVKMLHVTSWDIDKHAATQKYGHTRTCQNKSVQHPHFYAFKREFDQIPFRHRDPFRTALPIQNARSTLHESPLDGLW